MSDEIIFNDNVDSLVVTSETTSITINSTSTSLTVDSVTNTLAVDAIVNELVFNAGVLYYPTQQFAPAAVVDDSQQNYVYYGTTDGADSVISRFDTNGYVKTSSTGAWSNRYSLTYS